MTHVDELSALVRICPLVPGPAASCSRLPAEQVPEALGEYRV
nr:hypothetical protein OH826_12020 [Streptomyces sp. NBC_00899]